ncbi:MAG: hypothetical protein A2133_00580 [Actinobacteria bacterium RBG_16_64_13]|nr:MAG: hypothetical protein A2133_00580 [Actinobacteria bacterium RBG_16_64_13]
MQEQSHRAINTRSTAAGALALRGIDPLLRSALEAEAARLGLSLNATVLHILRSALGLTEIAGVHHDLDALAGTWSRAEAEEFTRAIQHFEEVDPSMWTPDPGSS